MTKNLAEDMKENQQEALSRQERQEEGARALAKEENQILKETDPESGTDALKELLDDLDAGRVKLIKVPAMGPTTSSIKELKENREYIASSEKELEALDDTIKGLSGELPMDDQKAQVLTEARVIIEGNKLLANQEERQNTIMAEQSEDEFVEKLSTDTEKIVWQNDDKNVARDALGEINDAD